MSCITAIVNYVIYAVVELSNWLLGGVVGAEVLLGTLLDIYST
jgi:hypothetical protein